MTMLSSEWMRRQWPLPAESSRTGIVAGIIGFLFALLAFGRRRQLQLQYAEGRAGDVPDSQRSSFFSLADVPEEAQRRAATGSDGELVARREEILQPSRLDMMQEHDGSCYHFRDYLDMAIQRVGDDLVKVEQTCMQQHVQKTFSNASRLRQLQRLLDIVKENFSAAPEAWVQVHANTIREFGTILEQMRDVDLLNDASLETLLLCTADLGMDPYDKPLAQDDLRQIRKEGLGPGD